mgnify:CR=1 FL=1
MRIAYGLCEGRLASGHGNKVDMIIHEAIGPEGQAILSGMLCKQGKIECSIFVREENPLSPVPPLDDVMRDVRHYNPRYPCHEQLVKHDACQMLSV